MISLRSTPFNIDFAGNKPRFSIKAQPFITRGVKDSWTFIIFQIPYVSGVVNTFTLTTNHATIIRTIYPSNIYTNNPTHIKSSNNVQQIRELVIDSLCNDSKITDNYVVNAWCGTYNNLSCCFLQLTERVCAAATTITLEYKQGSTVVTVVDNLPVIYFQEHISGVEESLRTNHSVIGRYLVTRFTDNRGEYLTTNESETENIESPTFRLQCNDDNADIDTSMLLSYFNGMDIPKINETVTANVVRHNIIHYRIQYAETYDSITTTYYRTSQEFLLLNATIDRHNFVENCPDWDTLFHSQISSYNKLINWGCDRIAIKKIFHGCESYVHIANFTSSDRNATVSFTIGTTTTNTTVAIPALSIVRIPVHISDDTAYQYSVKISDGTDVILNHLFEIVEKPYNAHVLLLQNHVGLAETLFVDNIVIDKDVQNDEVALNDALLSDLSSKGTSLTIRTGYKSKQEMALLGDALHNTDNYILADKLAYRINFTESTITILDENDDLQSAEFSVSLGKPISREIKQVDDSTVAVGPITDNTTFYQSQI